MQRLQCILSYQACRDVPDWPIPSFFFLESHELTSPPIVCTRTVSSPRIEYAVSFSIKLCSAVAPHRVIRLTSRSSQRPYQRYSPQPSLQSPGMYSYRISVGGPDARRLGKGQGHVGVNRWLCGADLSARWSIYPSYLSYPASTTTHALGIRFVASLAGKDGVPNLGLERIAARIAIEIRAQVTAM